jgi:hypothetical protein
MLMAKACSDNPETHTKGDVYDKQVRLSISMKLRTSKAYARKVADILC